jgi:hypothetical protein
MKLMRGYLSTAMTLIAIVMSSQGMASPITYTDAHDFARLGTTLLHSFTTHSFLSELGKPIASGDTITIPHSPSTIEVTFSYDFGYLSGTQEPVQIVGADGTHNGG